MNKNNKIIIAAIAVVALLLVIGALFASGILSGNGDDKNTTSYEVSFIDGDDVIKTLNVKENNSVSRISDPEKEGYIFTGWYSDKELTNEFDFENTFITENTNIYAKWVKASEPEPGDITFTVTFNTDGASSIASQTVKEGEKAVKPADPLKSGYKFEGWYSDSSFTTKFDFKTPITFDITLYAKFTASQGGGGGGGSITPPPVTDTTYSIIYNGNDNDSGTVPDTQTLSKNNLSVQISTQNSLSRDRYTFVCWNTKSDGTGTNYFANSSVSFRDLNSDLTLYAKWIIGTYDVEGNTASISIDTTNTDLIDELVSKNIIDLADTSNYENVNTVNIPKDLLSNIQKKNENNKKDISVKTAKGSVQLSSNVVDRIIRTNSEGISIKIDSESNSETKYSIEITSGGNPIDKFPEAIKISIPYTLKDGENPQDIVVYYIDGEDEYLVHGTYNEETNCVDVLTNHFSTYEIRNDAKYSINFILNGGAFSEGFNSSDYVRMMKFNDYISEPAADPLKAGYNFIGWFTDKSPTTAWDFNTDTVKTLDNSDPYTINLYAKWEAVSYNITYNLDGGINSSGNPTSYIIKSETITFENPTKTGYTFKGWFTDEEFNNQITSIVKGSFEDVTLHASWEKNKYSVTLSSGTGYELVQLQNSSIVEYGDNFQFKLSINEDFKQSTPVVKSNSKTISAVNDIYTIPKISENQVVTVEGIETNTYSITFANKDGFYSVDNSNPVNEGENFTFTITLNDAYSQSILTESSVKVFGKCEGISKAGVNVNQYTITNVTSDLVVFVDGLKKNEYVVTFISDGNIILDQKVSHGDSAALINNLTKPGYKFEGWCLDNAGNIKYSNEAITEDTTLYAKWDAGTTNYFIYIYQEKISYAENASTMQKYELINVKQLSGTINDNVSVNYQDYLTKDFLESDKGFKFNESISDTSGVISAEDPLILKLYFDRIEFTMTFKAPEGSLFFESVSEITAKYGQPVSPIKVTLPGGYTLDHWYESEIDKETPYLFTTMPDHDVTLHSKFTKIYYLEYDANGGIGDLPYKIGYANETNVTLFGPNYPTPGSYILTREGYTFGGWEYNGTIYQPGVKFTIPSNNVTMTAVWLRNAYSITVNDNENGSISVTETSAAPKSKISVTVLPNAGYELARLIVQDSNGQDVTIENGSFVMPADDVTISAEFKLIEYQITFIDWNENEIQSETYHYGDTVILPKNPERQSDETYKYTFSSWTPAITSVTADATYKAQYTSEFIEYTITYQNYDKSVITTQTYHYNDATSAPQKPEREGYAFAYWCSDESLQHEYQFSTMPADNLTLYAKWNVNSYNVSFHPNNGNNEITQTFEFNSLITAPAASKTGYTLDGWYTDSSLQNKWDFESNRMPASNINLYAKWNLETYTITLHNGEETSTVKYDVTNDSISLPAVSRTGHDFLGWYETNAETEFVYSKGVTAGDIDLYSKFSVNQYTITFESNGGSSVPAVTQNYDTSVSKPNNPAKEGYTFVCWCSDESLQHEYQFSTMPADDIILYAKWNINSYTLTINYVYEDNSQAYPQHIETLPYGSEYSVASPEVSGMLPDKTAVSGTILNNTTVTVTYSDSYAANLNGNNYKNLEDALNVAVSGDKVILLNDYTLKQNITVKKGVFLVLPCSDEDTGYDLTADYEKQHNPNGTMEDSNPHSVLYRTLTIPEGITVDLQGQLLVNAVTGRAAGGYHVMDITGGYAQIILNGNISVKNEGILEVCGYITGDGEITAESGAEIRDMYIVQHWRGGTQAVSMYGKKVFPFNEYDCHNIQSKLVIYSGASLLGNVKMFEGEFTGYHYTRFPQVNNTNGLIRLAEGAYLVKTFDPDALNGSSSSDKGRVTIEIHGGATASESTLWIVKQNLSSGDYIFPIDGDISFELYDGIYHIDKRFKFLTGSELIVHEGADLAISSTALITLYDQFDDLCNISGTKYPDRPSAILTMMDNTSITVEGYFAGILRISGNIGDVQINTDGAKGLTTSINEAGSSSGSVNPNIFTTKIQNRISLDYGDPQVEYVYVEKGQKISLADAPEKTGHEFKGWYSDPEFNHKYDLNALVSSNFTLYAKYDRAEFSVTFDSKGGSNVEKETVVYEGQIEEPQSPSKIGYTFAGWFTDSDCTQAYDFNTIVTDSFTLYAGWTLESYLISYELNGGSNHENNPLQYDVENPKVFLAPSRTGYTFEGWYAKYTEEDGFTDKITGTSGKSENLTLYANWTINTYTVTLDYVSDDILNKTINADYNSVLNENELGMDRTGYTLTGWYRDSSYSIQWNFNEDEVINNVTLYAKWEAVSYSITYELDGGINASGNPTEYTIDSETITLNDPTRLGYTFLGWFETSDFSGSSVTEIVKGSTGDKTLYAKWEAVEYTVSFVNWDDSEISSKRYHYGDIVIDPINPERQSDDKYSYTFSGWGKEIASVTEDATYKAVYTETPIDYEISYVLNGGENNQSNPDIYNCETATITLKDPVRVGYTFKGWFTDEGFENPITEIVKGSTGNVTLYAGWEIFTFSITVPTSDDYTIRHEGNTTVNYGSDFEFTITVAEMYDINKIIVKSNGVELTKSNEKYVIENITENQTISVEGIVKNSYSVTIQSGEGFILTSSSETVAYGESVTFTFTLDEAYFQSEYTIKQNGSAVTLADNQFTIESVTSDINITVEGVRKNTYSVTFEYDNESPSATETITHGNTVAKPADPTKEGYVFAGWTLNGSSYDFTAPVIESITLTANWNPITYNVHFDGNGSTSGEMSNQNFTYGEAQNLTANAFVKTGYTFAGWSDSSTGSKIYEDQASVNNLTTTNNETVTLYAVWTPKSYTITYDANTGSGSIANQTAAYGSSITLSKGSELSKTGYNLVKWNTQADGSGDDYSISATFNWNVEGNMTLYAVWELTVYTITYVLDGGTNSFDNPATYTIDSEIIFSNPAKLGYEFKGWFRNADFSNLIASISKGTTGSITLYAEFVKTQYTISFNTKGGSPTQTPVPYDVDTESIILPNNVLKSGYDFGGWFTDADYTTPFNYEKGTTTGNITLYAKWTPIEYTITYELNGGTVPENPGKYTIESETITINNPTKTGYIFAGWSGTDISETKTNLQIQKGSIGDRTYTANWTPTTYKVQFNGNGSTSGEMNNQTFTYDIAQNLTLNKFVKTGYTFAGWSVTSGGAVKYADNQSVNNLASTEGATVTLYAVWSINHYTVTLPNNTLGGISYTAAVVNGYDASFVEYGKDFKFTITFESSIGNNSPVIVFGEKTISGTTSDNSTFEFTISNVTDNLNLSLQLVSSLENVLKDLVNQDTSNDYKLILEGTTLTVSIINPNADVSGLIGKISDATSQEVPVNADSGRTGITSFLAYLPDDDTLWADNLADYTVNLAGCTIIFKQDEDAVEEAKLAYFLQIEQLCRLARDDASSAILSAYVGIENDERYLKVVSKNDDESFFNGLMANFSVPFAMAGHPDAVYGCYSVDKSFTTTNVKIGIDRAINDQYNLYKDAMGLLKNLNIPITSINGKISEAFMPDGTGYDGFGRYYCSSDLTGIRYTDIYHFSFNHYDDALYEQHSLIVDEAQTGITFKHLGHGPNEFLDNELMSAEDSFTQSWFNNNFDPLTRWYVYVTANNSLLTGIPSINADYQNEYHRLSAGEVIVINIDPNSGHTVDDIEVTSTSGNVTLSGNMFIMPNGDVTISLKTSSEAEMPTIIESPSSPMNMTVGDSKSLTVSASVNDGGSLSYAWYAADGPSDTTMDGAKKVASSATYMIPADKPEGIYYYFCVVTNTLGTTSSTSISSIVTVQITAQTYSISFETNGGSVVDDTAYQSLKQGDALSLPSSEKFGYQFDGWYSDAALSVQAPTTMPANNLTLYAKWSNVLSSDGSVTVFENVGDKPWLYDEQNGAYHSSYSGVSNSDDTTMLPEFSVTLTGPGVLSFDYMLKSNKVSADIKQDALCYKFSEISLYAYYAFYLLSPSPDYLNGTFAVTDSWSKASVAIDAAEDESVTIYFAYAKLADDGTEEDGLWIKNLSFSLAMHLKVDSNNSAYGTVSATSGDKDLTVGSEYVLPSASAITLSAVPNAGYKFYCWVDENNNVLSTNSTYSFSLINNLNITAVFAEVETQYVAQIGKNFYTSLETALADAKSGDMITLLNDYEMISDATVKAGVFLLLPCMDNDVGYTSTGYNPNGTTTSVKDQYRTLTIPQNVTLTIEGKVLVNAVTGYPGGGDYDQDIRGGYAQINLSGNIVVKSGGLLDNCGYIKGSGEVTAESGAEIRDLFVIESWRGGSHALNLIGGLFKVLSNDYGDPFPLNEYNCHNIESKITIYSGASLLGNVKMYGNESYNYTRYPQIDNNNGLIHLNDNAYLVKTYDAVADRVNIAIYGGASAESSKLTFSMGITKEMMTSKFTYPIDGDISFELHDGNYTFNNDFKFLTGATLTVYEDATLTVPENKKVVFYDVFKDVDNNPNTNYPDRPAAHILLKGSSTLNIQGSFGGIVKYETSGDQIIVGTNAITQNVESKEANGYNNTETPSITLQFSLQTQKVTA